MEYDKLGRPILSEDDLCDLYLRDPDRQITGGFIRQPIKFNPALELSNTPTLNKYVPLDISIAEYDRLNQNSWYMPKEYANMDIAYHILGLCKTDVELQRAGDELIKYQERGLLPLLCYMKYLVDTMEKHKILWGVGRGSSVSSYVLYLLKVHRIDSMYYDLSVEDFLK